MRLFLLLAILRRYWLANCVLKFFATRYREENSISFAQNPSQKRLFDVLFILQQLNSEQEIEQFISQTQAMAPVEILHASLYLISFEEWELAPLLVWFVPLCDVVSDAARRVFRPFAAAKLDRAAHTRPAMRPILALLPAGAVESECAGSGVCCFGAGRVGLCGIEEVC